MKELLKCAFNVDTGCVDAVYSEGSMITVACTAVENEAAENM